MRMYFDVAFSSHDALREGLCEVEVVRIATEAESFVSGQISAIQKGMAYQAIRHSEYLMPTASYPVI